MPDITIVAADDHEIFLQGLKSLFSGSDTFSLLGTCNHRDQLQALIQQHCPKILLLDLSMPGPSIEEILKLTQPLDTSIIILTMKLDAKLANRLVTQGISGYVLKESAFEELEVAINHVLAGEVYLSPLLLEDMHKGSQFVLTEREKEVVKLAAEGLSNNQIAEHSCITERTVRFHFSNICLKLQANGRSNAIAKSLKLNLIDID